MLIVNCQFSELEAFEDQSNTLLIRGKITLEILSKRIIE